jgi:hypothetical protein
VLDAHLRDVARSTAALPPPGADQAGAAARQLDRCMTHDHRGVD